MKRLGHLLGALICFYGAYWLAGVAIAAQSGRAINPMTGQLQRSSPQEAALWLGALAIACVLLGLFNLAMMGDSD